MRVTAVFVPLPQLLFVGSRIICSQLSPPLAERSARPSAATATPTLPPGWNAMPVKAAPGSCASSANPLSVARKILPSAVANHARSSDW